MVMRMKVRDAMRRHLHFPTTIAAAAAAAAA
jgi:hypothetical protein